MQHNIRQAASIGLSLILAFFLWRHPLMRRSPLPPDLLVQSFGRYTGKEISDRSLAIVSLLAPQADRVQMELDPHPGYARLRMHHREIRRHWMVYCTDDTGRSLANLDWNADTGALIQVVPVHGQTVRRRQGNLEKAQATYVARLWLEELKVGGAGLRWRPGRPATCAYGT